MSWLRLDDSFSQHPKFAGWKPVDKWAWIELMLYCARFRTGGYVPQDYALLPRSVTPKLLALAIDCGWLDTRADGLWIHDWEVYNPHDSTAAERMRRYRERQRDATEHDPDRNAARNAPVTDAVTRASRARARVSVPSPSKEEPSVSPTRARDATDGLTALSSEIDEQLHALRHDEGGSTE